MPRSRRTRASQKEIDVPRRARAALLDEIEAALTRTRESVGELEANELASRLSAAIMAWAREHVPKVADELTARYGGEKTKQMRSKIKDDVGPEKTILKALPELKDDTDEEALAAVLVKALDLRFVPGATLPPLLRPLLAQRIDEELADEERSPEELSAMLVAQVDELAIAVGAPRLKADETRASCVQLAAQLQGWRVIEDLEAVVRATEDAVGIEWSGDVSGDQIDALTRGRELVRYEASETYRAGDVIRHPKLGKGIVVRTIGSSIEVQFASGIRRLAHRAQEASVDVTRPPSSFPRRIERDSAPPSLSGVEITRLPAAPYPDDDEEEEEDEEPSFALPRGSSSFDDEPESRATEPGRPSPLARALAPFLRTLVDRGELELAKGTTPESAAEQLADALGEMGADSARRDAIYEALIELDCVDELFVDERELARRLAEP
jgi:hypothetical protein